ncbi:hypothetical protein BLOT_014658 [Blomia tropicalis]|nr:hypothetical protein BLOT_014658 [Blomia tropicalis]
MLIRYCHQCKHSCKHSEYFGVLWSGNNFVILRRLKLFASWYDVRMANEGNVISQLAKAARKKKIV